MVQRPENVRHRRIRADGILGLFHGLGNVTQFTNRLGKVTEYMYTSYSNPLAVYDATDGALTLYTYFAGREHRPNHRCRRQRGEYAYNPLNQQTVENWLGPLPPGKGQGDGWISNGTVSHTIQTFDDADGETLGVTETDANNSANATDYQYSYDADGNVLTSRMAPGDLS